MGPRKMVILSLDVVALQIQLKQWIKLKWLKCAIKLKAL